MPTTKIRLKRRKMDENKDVFEFSIEASNGKIRAVSNPDDPYNRKQNCQNGLDSLIAAIQDGNYEIIDET